MIKLLKGLALVAVAALIVAPLLSAAGNAEAGKRLYGTKCASCHAKDGAGNPGIAKALKVELKHLGSKEVQAKTDAELTKEILEGTGKMKAVKLTAEDAANVVAYVRTLKQ
ncbi:MAG: c-type cytochrome [Candidatus Acidiferrales bacterium]